MIYWKNYYGHNADIKGTRKTFDNTIYSFDIETTSYIILNGKQYNNIEYEKFSDEEKKQCEFHSTMYIWMFSINEDVYYGRTWDELRKFLDRLDNIVPNNKIVFIHNLSYEFQFLRSVFNFNNVLARKSRKVMQAFFDDYNIELRCTYMMSNCALSYLPKLFKLPVKKMVGDLDYNKIRTYKTVLTDEEMKYCENDCLVIYYYIKRELETYKEVKKIPLTSTGHVRRELKERVLEDYSYRNKVNKAINTEPHIYNLLLQAFAGGYTHANWIYTDEIVKDIDSFDFTSSYPYVLVTHQFPSYEFKKSNIKTIEKMSKRFAYLLVVKFKNIKCKYYNNFISQSKCRNIKGR